MTDEADLNCVVRAVGLLDVSVSKSKAHLSSRRRPSNGRTDAAVSPESVVFDV